MKKKVLIVTSWYPGISHPVSGIFVHEQAVVLSRYYDVRVLVIEFPRRQDLMRGKFQLGAMREERDGLVIQRMSGLPPLPYLSPLIYATYALMAQQGFQAMQRDWGKPDLIHAHVVLPCGWLGVKIGEYDNIPVILTEHSGPFSMHVDTVRKKKLVQKTFHQARRIVVVSPALLQNIRSFCDPRTVKVIGNLIRSEYFTPLTTADAANIKAPSNALRLLSIALLSENKGVNYLLDAMHILQKRHNNVFELVIGGDGPARHQLEGQAHRLGIARHCRFLGLLDREMTRHWMQRCDLFILPSLHETFGIVIGEALACGKPVIATRCGGPEFIVTPETGELVEPANAQALADAIERWMQQRHHYDPAVIRASVVERFGEEAFLRNLAAVYEQIWAG